MALSAQQLEKARLRVIDYPTGDGKPMAETDLHVDQLIYTREALKVRYADDPDVYVAGNNLLYWEEGNPRKSVSPDVYVVFGIPKYPRDLYKVWEEGKGPDVVFEFTSKTTRKEDVGKKRPLYRDVLKVREYFRFDPTGDYLSPRLQGDRLENGVYVPIPLVDGRMYSEMLELYLVVAGERLRLFDPKTGEFLRTLQEAEEHAAQEAQRAEAEAQARAEAEAEIARLRTELAALRQEKS